MTKFLMTTYTSCDKVIPVAINTDLIVSVEDIGDTESCAVQTIIPHWYRVNEPYEDVVKKLTPFIPFDDMTTNERNSEWLRNYIDGLSKGDSSC